MIVVADEVAVGLAGTDLIENPFFAGFENAGRGNPDCRRLRLAAKIAYELDGFAIEFWVVEIAVESGYAGMESGLELRKIADEDNEGGGACVWSADFSPLQRASFQR